MTRALTAFSSGFIEPLERRSMLSASLDAEGMLTVVGRAGPDKITVYLAPDDPAHLVVKVNRKSFVFNTADVQGMHIAGRRGADRLVIDESFGQIFIPATITGGAGKDVLAGGSGDDQLYGQGGMDKLYGNAGFDWVIGGAMADYVDGGAGFDVLGIDPAIDTFASDPVDMDVIVPDMPDDPEVIF
jgi:Ca2+-binding RTX toxin-like protein